jgi:DnaA-homolog protein
MKQLPLGVRLHDRALFESFFAGSNVEALEAARALARPPDGPSVIHRHDSRPALLFLHGVDGAGKSHLLQAICAAVAGAAYLPLGELRALGPDVLDGLAGAPLLAIDDAGAIAGVPGWEQRLFTLYNDCQLGGTRLVIAAREPATNLPLLLPDLRSRLAAMPHYALKPLDEIQQRSALQARAATRGLVLQEDALQYLQRHFARDMGSQYALLERLDTASLEAQRPLTLPFIRRVLGDAG